MAFLPNLYFVDLRQSGIDAKGRVQKHETHINILYENILELPEWKARYDITANISNIVIIVKKSSKQQQLGFAIVVPVKNFLAQEIAKVVIFSEYLDKKDDIVSILVRYVQSRHSEEDPRRPVVVSGDASLYDISPLSWLTDATGEGAGPCLEISKDITRQSFCQFLTMTSRVLKMSVRLYKSHHGGFSVRVDDMHIWSLTFPDIDYYTWEYPKDWCTAWKCDSTVLLRKGQCFKTTMVVEKQHDLIAQEDFRLPEEVLESVARVLSFHGMFMKTVVAHRLSSDE